ncbi:uncharacterized aarF domain-containing protein kinase At1g71810, chloroplastic isoform X2 [Cryptomeria japonica]|uniref:uncharacterized aarF domain-containing protein kinase At1g71810, chloroplastic isoform X2 n=1 Tax=Cryptomeria japonica TaxID=3369 RepID=UPI0027D9EFB6|nr:uncharacterized aarF domain-containing protein kinase At1g71810, chloroplastic isoform X2 [Cryptomeria japonica]
MRPLTLTLTFPPHPCHFHRYSASAISLNLHQNLNSRRRLARTCRVKCFRSENLEETDTFSKYSGYLFEAGSSEAELLNEYDATKIGSIYRRRPVLLFRRLLQIGSSFGRWFFLRYIDNVLGRSDYMFKERAAELRSVLVRLGPAYVKVAQAISSRPASNGDLGVGKSSQVSSKRIKQGQGRPPPVKHRQGRPSSVKHHQEYLLPIQHYKARHFSQDVVPPAYLEELSLLQDRIAPFSTDIALDIIEEELGLPVEHIFSDISLQPIAAASLGQVYQARLRSNGEIVAVKVQRPGVRAAIALDIFILRLLVGYVRKAVNLNTDLQAVVDEWASSLFREMDYEAEAQNGLRFRQLFGRLPDVVIPKMYKELSSCRVLVMEWVEGQKLSEVKDLHLVEVGVYCSLTQLLECGFYHADPHPGNLLRTYDGKLAYLDFGMMGEFNQDLREGLIEACLHLVNREFDDLAGDFITLGLLPPTARMSDVAKALTDVFQNAVSKGVRNIDFGDLSGNLGRTMYKYKFQIPSYFSLVIRSLAVLEGVALSSDPNYKVLSTSYPWIARKILTDNSPQLRSTLQSLLYKDGTFRIDRLESLVSESLRSTTDDTLTGPQKTDNESVLMRNRILTFTLSEKGDFVREIFLEELAKGIDALNRSAFERTASNVIANLPMAPPFTLHFVEDEDIINLKTLRRLILLLSNGFVENMNHGAEEADVLLKENNVQKTWEEAIIVLQQVTYRLIIVYSLRDLLSTSCLR